VGNVLQVKKNVFSEFFWHHWSKNARGYVANQALSACPAAAAGGRAPPTTNLQQHFFKPGKDSICTLN
jgi:hypothetical protein